VSAARATAPDALAPRETPAAEHFEDLAKQAHAARLGLWVFLASEVLLFGALFALFASYRTHYPAAFHEAVVHNTKVLGSINTLVLLTSSTLVACGVHALRSGRPKLAARLVAGTMSLGIAFLAIKFTEYTRHFADGIEPGGRGAYFAEHRARGLAEFWTLYYGMTGLHAVHVTVGVVVLGAMVLGVRRGTIADATAYRLELGATYWHLVDLVWIFLWPLFYLA
jgi:cytochrome c oxidase subunit 3